MSEPEWTRVRPSLDQKSVIDYVITDAQLLRESGDVCIDSTDIGSFSSVARAEIGEQNVVPAIASGLVVFALYGV